MFLPCAVRLYAEDFVRSQVSWTRWKESQQQGIYLQTVRTHIFDPSPKSLDSYRNRRHPPRPPENARRLRISISSERWYVFSLLSSHLSSPNAVIVINSYDGSGSGFGSSTREWRVYDVGGHRSLVRSSSPCMSCDRC